MAEQSWFKRLKTSIQVKQADTFFPQRLSAWGSWLIGTPRTDYNYARDLGDGLSSSVVMPVVHWLQRSFPEAPLVVRKRQGDDLEIVDNHPMVQLVDRPNGFYPGTLLWMTTISDWCWYGESYWRILRTRGGQPGELWWLPPWSVEPQWPSDQSEFISHYEYRPRAGGMIELSLDEVIHFRHGLDPRNHRHGLPPLRAVLAEIWSDNEAMNWVGSLLRNMAVAGMILSPKGETFVGPEEMERVKEYVKSRFTGDQRGAPMALGAPIDVHRLSWSPSEMDLTVVRNTAEERVSAALGIPAAVIGFGTGLANSKVGATMHEFIRLAWANGIVPIQRLMAAELQRVLLPQFELQPDNFLVSWNYDEVSALEPDQNELASRLNLMVAGGWLKVSEARQAMGYESTPDDEIYLRPSSLTPTDPKDQMPEPEPLPDPMRGAAQGNGSGNGNGNGARNGLRVVQQRALKQGSLDEWLTGLIGQTARRLDRIPDSATRLAAKLSRTQTNLGQQYEPQIRQVFYHYAEAASTAARELLQPQKASVENVVRTAILHERLPLAQIRFELEGVYREMYAEMLELLSKALTEAGHPDLTDPARVRRNLQLAAGQRAGLLNLSGEARTAILSTLESATAAGLSEDDMIAAIKDAVPRGRWQSIETRAQIISRSESRYATNVAASGYARDQGLRMLILDARLGPSDEICELRNGFIVTPAQAEALAASEHPNGTYAAIPLTNANVTV